jgi:transposase
MSNTIQLKMTSSEEELKKTLQVTKDEGQKTRIKIILHIRKGVQRKKIAEKLSINIDTVTDVVKRYNAKGIDGLKTNLGGRPEGNPKWDIQIFKDLKVEIKKQQGYWSIPMMVRWIKEHKKETIPESTVWYHMTHLHMSYKSARPHPYLGDKVRQEEFKKKWVG